jgi:hypothetical protein
VLASFADQYGTETYWIYSWNGQTLHLLSETENDSVTGIDSDITNPTFLDTDGDGTLEVIGQKATDEQDDEGELSGDAIFTVYTLRDGRLTPSAPASFFKGFARGKGKPSREEYAFAVEGMGAYRVTMINGDDASTAVTSATASMNGAAVLTPNDFKRSLRTVARTVTLGSGSNTLAVQLQGEPRSHIWILVAPLP